MRGPGKSALISQDLRARGTQQRWPSPPRSPLPVCEHRDWECLGKQLERGWVRTRVRAPRGDSLPSAIWGFLTRHRSWLPLGAVEYLGGSRWTVYPHSPTSQGKELGQQKSFKERLRYP